ncbi:DoxX family membrane protein [Psychroserpens sp. AS72]|uniref:DoxX family membrane protein n=1 Tax=Psychroserpens sp. AS72 TaxID=3135775 RepID=UPI0031765858
MNPKVFMVLRIILGLFVLVFGLNKFFEFLPAPEGMSEEAMAYFGALVNSKTMVLVAIVEIVAGLALILNKFGALLALILMSVSVNAVLFHAVLDQANIAGALVLLVLNIAVLYGYKDRFKSLTYTNLLNNNE